MGGGYVSGLICHPTNSSLLYARTDVGGAYRWNSANSTWIPITDGAGFSMSERPFHNVESLALDPTNDQMVYLVTGEGSTGRLYTSSNQGNTWTWGTLPFAVSGNGEGRAIGERLKLDPANPSTMFYGSRNAGLWKSTDSGQTWNQVTSLSSVTMAGNSGTGVEHLMFDTSAVGGGATTWIMYAAIAPDYVQAAGLTSTLYNSADGGASWTATNLPALTPINGASRSYRLAADRKNPNKVYAYDSGGAWWNQWADTAHLWVSTDGGHTFTERTAPYAHRQRLIAVWLTAL